MSLKNYPKTNHLRFKLLSLGAHIGHHSIYNQFNNRQINQFLDGSRNKHYIININHSLFFIKKALHFLKTSHSSTSTSLFFFSMLDSTYDLTSRLFIKKKFNMSSGISFVYLN